MAATATSHVYTGQPTNFGQTTTAPPSTGGSTNPGQYNPSQQAALVVLTQAMKAVPQYLVMPTTGNTNPLHLDFEGPAGYVPRRSRVLTASTTSSSATA